jgi:hypothetical protein
MGLNLQITDKYMLVTYMGKKTSKFYFSYGSNFKVKSFYTKIFLYSLHIHVYAKHDILEKFCQALSYLI